MRVRAGDLEIDLHEWGSGPPVVLLHGLGDDHRAWRRLVPELSLRHRVLAPDLRGHGGTSLGEPDGTLGQLAGDVAALLDELDLERVDLVGFSLGGAVALQAAITHPGRVERLVGVATSSRVGSRAAARSRERLEAALAGPEALEGALAEDLPTLFRPGSADLADHLELRRRATRDPRGFANGCRANLDLAEHPLDPDLHRIQAPTLVVAGDEDTLCPVRASEIVVSGIAGARLEVIAGAAHEVPLEQPQVLSTLLREILQR